MIRIAGTGFRLPGPPPTSGYLGGEQQRTVRVSFDGVESEWAYAASDQLILARVPQYRGPANVSFPLAQSLRVANLDDNEAEIPGEFVISTDAYTIDLPGLSTESYYQRVVRSFLHMFKRHVTPNTFSSASRDAASADFTDNRLQAKTPCLYLIGPNTNVNRFYSVNREDFEVNPSNVNEWMLKRFPVTLDFEFELMVCATSQMHMFSLCQACVLLFRDITDVRVPDFAGQDEPYKDYETEMLWQFHPNTENAPDRSDLFKSRAGVIIRGVHVDDADGTIVREGYRITGNDGYPVIDIQLN